MIESQVISHWASNKSKMVYYLMGSFHKWFWQSWTQEDKTPRIEKEIRSWVEKLSSSASKEERNRKSYCFFWFCYSGSSTTYGNGHLSFSSSSPFFLVLQSSPLLLVQRNLLCHTKNGGFVCDNSNNVSIDDALASFYRMIHMNPRPSFVECGKFLGSIAKKNSIPLLSTCAIKWICLELPTMFIL